MAEISKYRYFLYSKSQYVDRTNIESTIGYKYTPGQVLKNGKWRDYTEISTNPVSSRYPDSTIIAEGFLSNLTFTKEKKIQRER